MGKLVAGLSFLVAPLAFSVFFTGYASDNIGLRWAGSGLAVFGIWLGDRAARKLRDPLGNNAAVINVFALLGMGFSSLYLYLNN